MLKAIFQKKTTLLLIGSLILVVGTIGIYRNVTFTKLPPSELKVVPIQTWITEKGLKVYFVQRNEIPIVDVQLTFDAGSARDADQPGIASATSSALTTGTDTLTEDELATAIDNVGAILDTDVGRDQATLHLRTLSSRKEQTFAVNVLEQLLKHAAFNATALERVKKQMLVALHHQEQSPRTLSHNAFYATLFTNHPYGHPVEGTKAAVNALTRDDVRAFFHHYYVNNNAILSIVGDLDDRSAQAIANQISNAMEPGGHAPPHPGLSPLEKARQQHIAFPSKQTHIIQGQLGVDRKNPDYFDLMVGSHILGGDPFVSWLFDEIRVKQGLAYSVYSQVAPMQHTGLFIMGAQTRNQQAPKTLLLFNQLLRDFIHRGPSPDDLWTAKQNLIGGFPLRIASNSQILDYLSTIGFYDLPLDYLDKFVQHVKNVNKDSIVTAFNKHIHPDKMVTITVGDQEKKA